MSFFFFNDTATTEIYTYGHTLSLHDALPIYRVDIVVEAALQAARVAGGVLAHQRRILRPALVRAPPARVLHHRHRGGEQPVDAGRLHRPAGGRCDAADQLGLVRRAQAGVVRDPRGETGSASCRERGWQSGESRGVAG